MLRQVIVLHISTNLILGPKSNWVDLHPVITRFKVWKCRTPGTVETFSSRCPAGIARERLIKRHYLTDIAATIIIGVPKNTFGVMGRNIILVWCQSFNACKSKLFDKCVAVALGFAKEFFGIQKQDRNIF